MRQYKFYQLKIIRKGEKPPVWMRVNVPAYITYAQLAVVLQCMLQQTMSHAYEFEFFHKKESFMQWEEPMSGKGFYYSITAAEDAWINELFETESWFTFRIMDDEKLPEYRVEIEKAIETVRLSEKEEVEWPLILKQKSAVDDIFWKDSAGVNRFMQEKMVLVEETSPRAGVTFGEVVEGITQGKGIVCAASIPDIEPRRHRAPMSYLEEMSQTIQNHMAKSEGERKGTAFVPTDGIRPQDILQPYTIEDLMISAHELGVALRGKTKDSYITSIIEHVYTKEFMASALMEATENELVAFEKCLDSGKVKVSEDENKLLEIFSYYKYIGGFGHDCG